MRIIFISTPADVMASQRVLFNNSFNEVVGDWKQNHESLSIIIPKIFLKKTVLLLAFSTMFLVILGCGETQIGESQIDDTVAGASPDLSQDMNEASGDTRDCSTLSESELVKLKQLQSKISYDVLVPTWDRKSTRLNSSHIPLSRMPSSAWKKKKQNTKKKKKKKNKSSELKW